MTIISLTNRTMGFNVASAMKKSERSKAAAALGSIRTPAKAAAARKNGKKGGRPRKQVA